MTIAADSSADLLCRLIGLFAQRDLAAPGMTVDIAGKRMTVTVNLAELDDRTASLLAEKMARYIGVEAVTIDGTPLAYLVPATLVPMNIGQPVNTLCLERPASELAGSRRASSPQALETALACDQCSR